MSNSLIHFICRAAAHTEAPGESAHPSPLTICDGKWAYCATGLAADHEWRAITPTPLELLKHRVRELQKI